ncbi:MAG: NAD(P)/FAD-dependent oxidoreductase [bacterium]
MSIEILIVGGGPAGASTAIHLARLLPSQREKILVIDKQAFPREKPCGGGLSGRALATLADMGVEISVPSVTTDCVQYRFGGGTSRYHVPGACRIVRRAEFDTMLLRNAASRGVCVCEGESLTQMSRDGERFHVRTTRRSITPRVVIAADGAASLVRRLAGFPAPRAFARLHLYEIPVSEQSTPEFVDGAFTFDYSAVPRGVEGYVWDFPSRIGGRPHLNTGIYHRNARGTNGAPPNERSDSQRARLLAILDDHLRRRGIDPRQARLRSYPDIEYDPDVPLSLPGVLLTGSAAGINALTGEGIWQSLVYGRLAAESIAASYASNDLRFREYGERVAHSPMGRDLRLSRRIADLFYGRYFWPLYSFQERNADLRIAYIKSFAGQFDLARLSKTRLALAWWRHLATLAVSGGGRRPRQNGAAR